MSLDYYADIHVWNQISSRNFKRREVAWYSLHNFNHRYFLNIADPVSDRDYNDFYDAHHYLVMMKELKEMNEG